VTRLRPPLTVLAALLALMLCAASALASGKEVIRDCTDDEVLSKTYAQNEYRDALAELAADSEQYGNCGRVIKRAQLSALRDARAKRTGGGQAGGEGGGSAAGGGGGGGAAGGGGGAAGGGGGFGSPPASEQLQSATARERAAVDAGRGSPLHSVNLRGAAVKPGIGGASDLPAPLLVLLALLLAGALTPAAIRIRALVLARRA